MTRMFINNVASELAANVLAADTVIQILDPTSFPPAIIPGEKFVVTMENRASSEVEICEVTAIAGDLLTVVRAQENTTAKDFSAFDLVQSRLTAEPLNEFQDQIALRVAKTNDTGAAILPAGTTAQRPAGLAGYIRFNTETGAFEGHDGTQWGSTGGAAIGATPPPTATPGDLWWSDELGTMFIYYDDGNSLQWVSTTPNFNGGLYLPLSGGTVTGPVEFAGPTNFTAPASFVTLDATTANIATANVDLLNADATNFPVMTATVANITTLNVSGASNLAETLVDPNGNINVGLNQAAPTAQQIALHSTVGSGPAPEARWFRAAGANGVTTLFHKGTGGFQFIAETAGSFMEWWLGGAQRLYLSATDMLVKVKGTFFTPGVNATAADTVCQLQVQNNSGTGNGDVAAIGLLAVGTYGIKMYVRADGFWGVGGWSRAEWSLYSDPSGNLVATGNVTSASDVRLKEHIERISNPYDLIQHVHGYHFTWNKHSSLYANKAGKKDIGFLAHEVKAHIPEIISQTIDDPETGETYDTVCYEKIVPVLVEMIHELRARVIALEVRA